MRNKNIYMGAKSTARLPVFGRVDTGNEICLNAVATAYDALNGKMISRRFGVFDKTTPTEINGRFSTLRSLCRKYAPGKIVIVNELQNVVMRHFKGDISTDQAISMLNNIPMRYNLNPDFLNIASFHVNKAEQIHMPGPFGIDMFLLLGEQNGNKKMRRNKI